MVLCSFAVVVEEIYALHLGPADVDPQRQFFFGNSFSSTTPKAHSSSTTDVSTNSAPSYHTMSRSAADATRFTATSPRAYSKPTSINRASPSTYSASGTQRPKPNARLNPNARNPPPPIDPKRGNAPPAETPAEKVSRLREARLRERAAQVTGWDRLVIRGRRWADTAHKVTVLGLVGFSSVYKSPLPTFLLPSSLLHLYQPRRGQCSDRDMHNQSSRQP